MFACLFLPKFRLQAALRWREVHGPAAVVDELASKGVVLEVNRQALARGIRPGQTAVQAMACDASVALLPRSPDQEACLDQLLLAQGFSLSPLVELSGDGICLVDLRQAGADWEAMAARQEAAFRTQKLRVAVGIAPTPDLAGLAARGGAGVVREADRFAAALPIEALDPSPELALVLHGWGIRRVEDFLALPLADTTDRLGREAQRLRRKVDPTYIHPLRLAQLTPEYREAFDFEYEVETVEPLLFLLRRFLETLCGRLREAWRLAQVVELGLKLSDKTWHERTFAIPAPTAQVDVLFSILNTHLETLRLPQCAVGVRLKIQPAVSAQDQLQFFESVLRDPNKFGETLARLKALLGNDRVGVPSLENTHQPDRFVLGDRFLTELTASAEPLHGIPLRRYRPPRPGSVRLENGRPASVEAGSVRGHVQHCAGPYRLSGHWWDEGRWCCEEWDVEIPGCGIYRLSREGREWKVEGCYEIC